MAEERYGGLDLRTLVPEEFENRRRERKELMARLRDPETRDVARAELKKIRDRTVIEHEGGLESYFDECIAKGIYPEGSCTPELIRHFEAYRDERMKRGNE